MPHDRLARHSTATFVGVRLAWVVGPGALLAAGAQQAFGTSCAPDAGGCDLESIGFVLAIALFTVATLALAGAAFAIDAWRARGWGFAARHLCGLVLGAGACLAVFVAASGGEPAAAADLLPYLTAFALPYAAGLALARRRERER